jgi:multidrug efflux pump subunit AcrA (membrane-fusion protein)
MKNIDRLYKERDKLRFKNFRGTEVPIFFPRLLTLLIILLLMFLFAMLLPWQQTSSGMGVITALHPEDRVQEIIAPVDGRINKWHVRDGSKIKKGDILVEIIDIDPLRVSRVGSEVDVLKIRLIAAKNATALALSNYNRQRRLYKDGLASKKDFEIAGINYQKTLAEEKYYSSQLIRAQGVASAQTSQTIIAPRDGYIINTLASSETQIVKPGDKLATFLPETNSIAAEIYVSGNDIPLIEIGQSVRLVFDGWPSVQFSGWPSVSIGTFLGEVKVVDYSINQNGRFRVLIEQDKKGDPWPAKRFLRMGTQVQGFIQLGQVMLGYELWRQLNGFPIAINNKINKVQLYSNDQNVFSNGAYEQKYKQ